MDIGIRHLRFFLKIFQSYLWADFYEASNYRSIELTNCVCKTMERMINACLVWFLVSNGFLSNIQCGFRQGRNTLDHLVRVETFIRNSLAKKETCCIYIFRPSKSTLYNMEIWDFKRPL